MVNWDEFTLSFLATDLFSKAAIGRSPSVYAFYMSFYYRQYISDVKPSSLYLFKQEKGRFFIEFERFFLPFVDAHCFDHLLCSGDIAGNAKIGTVMEGH